MAYPFLNSAQWFSTTKDRGRLKEFLRIGVVVCAIIMLQFSRLGCVISRAETIADFMLSIAPYDND